MVAEGFFEIYVTTCPDRTPLFSFKDQIEFRKGADVEQLSVSGGSVYPFTGSVLGCGGYLDPKDG